MAFDANKYIKEYKKNKYDAFQVLVPKGSKQIWKRYADDMGVSMSKFIAYCVEKEIKGRE